MSIGPRKDSCIPGGIINKPIPLGEIQHFLESKRARIKIDDGDIMEIIGGPFKGEKGRVIRVNKIKDEVTAELLEASIPIPVTIATEFVKIVKKAKPREPEEPVEKKEPEGGEKPPETKEEPEPAEEPKVKKKRKSFLEELEEAGGGE